MKSAEILITAEKNPDTDKIKIMLKNWIAVREICSFPQNTAKGQHTAEAGYQPRLITELIKSFNEQKKEETKSGESVEILPEDESGE